MTSSYLQNNDYTPVQLRKPYQLPVNDIAQTVATLDSYWKQGAARVKAQYENVAGLNLTLESNQSYAQDFLKQAQDQMKKLSTKDLSSRDVQMEGLNLFKPILDNNNIKLDHTISNIRQSIIAEAQSYKTKGKGEEYADENLIDALNNFEGFNSKTDPNSLGSIYEKVKNARYVPYYDVQKEMLMLRDKCGEVSGTQINGLQDGLGSYDVNISGTPSSKIRDCLSALSSKANTQLQIMGRVRYNKDYKGLGRDILAMNSNLQTQYSTQIAEIEGVLTSKKIGRGENQRDVSTQEIEAYTTRKEQLNSALRGIKEQNAKIEANDFSEIEQNYNDYAGTAYRYNTINSFANSFYTEERNTEANIFAKMAAANDYALKQIKYKSELDAAAKAKEELEKNGLPFGSGNPEFSGDKGKESFKTYDQINSEILSLGVQNLQDFKRMFADLKNISGGSPKLQEMQISVENALKDGNISGQELTDITKFIQTFVNTADKEKNKGAIEAIKPYYKTLSDRANQIVLNKDILTVTDVKVGPEIKEKINKKIKDFGAINYNGIILDGNRLINIYKGYDSDYEIAYKEGPATGLSVGFGQDIRNTLPSKATYRAIRNKKTGEFINPPGNFINKAFVFLNEYNAINNSANELRDKFLAEYKTNQYAIWEANNVQGSQRLKERLAVAGGLSSSMKSEDLNKKINIQPAFGDGTVRVQFIAEKPEELEAIAKNMETNATQNFGSMWKEIDASRGIYELRGVKNFDLMSQFGDLSSMRQRISVSEQMGKSAILRNQIGKGGTTIEMKYDPAADKIYITNNNLYLQGFPTTNLRDAISVFNSLIE